MPYDDEAGTYIPWSKSVKDIHEAEDLMSRRTVRVYVSAVLFFALKAVMFSLCKVE